MDLGCLRRETVIGLNKIYLGLARFRFYPRYLVAVNDKVISQSIDAFNELKCVKFISARNAAVMGEDALTHHIETSAPRKRFYRDIEEGVHEGWTVTYAALQIAFYMGFRDVYIIGMDHRYEYSGAPNASHRLSGNDPNHFDPGYFGGGQEWNNPDLEKSEASYRVARGEFEKDGRRILDATVGGGCEVFDKVSFNDVFGQPA